MTEVINKVLKNLENNYKPNASVELESADGEICNVVCEYNLPATKEDLESLEKYVDATIPEDYKVFLNAYNGARLLATYEESMIITSEGLKLFDVANAIDNSRNLDFEAKDIAVGIFLDDYWIVLNATENIISVWEYGEKTDLNLRFEQFVDRFMNSGRRAFWLD
ncbi:SMI1/KNR4 family protein [Listeria booriae]|uniref:SMI1/KNR4 family protein n=1 Tax=Listeria booriae TaxID=1552123 RepID=A0A841XYA1_9LIST|nr:SMI1/KNR4 family protein [Listeria booriae]MBC1318119.1 SMI1/KNR4 family protein [Listeria booriae]